MKSTDIHFTLEPGEYLITPDCCDAKRYTIYLDGKKLNDVVGIIRVVIPTERYK